jgi:hypothetical protein
MATRAQVLQRMDEDRVSPSSRLRSLRNGRTRSPRDGRDAARASRPRAGPRR